MKNIRFTYVVIGLLAFASLTFFSCAKQSVSIKTDLKTYTGNLKFDFLDGSIEEIFSARMPWESKALNYFNVMQNGSTFNMWYNSFANNQDEYDGSFCYANSTDGQSWNRLLINNNTNILIHGNNHRGITGTVVFTDKSDSQYPYKMICSKLEDNDQKTFLYGSKDGLSWSLIKQLFNIKQDSQSSVIVMGDVYYVFSRYNDYSEGYQRAIGLSKLDNNFNIIQKPLLLLEASANASYPHIYNSAASKVNDSSIILLPTYYDDDGSIKIKLIYTNNMKDYYLINDNINANLFPGSDVKWAIVSPGLIPADENDTYWLYYYGTHVKHNYLLLSSNANVVYYRIKLMIHQ